MFDLGAQVREDFVGLFEEVLLIVAGTVVEPFSKGAQAVLGDDDAPDLFEVEPHEVLQLADALDPLDIGIAVAPAGAGTVKIGADEPDFLVVAQGPFGDPQSRGHRPYLQQAIWFLVVAKISPDGRGLAGRDRWARTA